eukprot:gene4153-2995_t
MQRRTAARLAGFTMQHRRGTGRWDEDHENDFNASTYMSARSTMRWYAGMERVQTRRNLNSRRGAQSRNNNNGLHHSGRGPFEREVERRGLPVDKYALTTTTGATRVAELVLLRRLALEEKAEKLLAERLASLRRAAPSSWMDEADGPLNPRFLERMQSHYATAITPLPELPEPHGDAPCSAAEEFDSAPREIYMPSPFSSRSSSLSLSLLILLVIIIIYSGGVGFIISEALLILYPLYCLGLYLFTLWRIRLRFNDPNNSISRYYTGVTVFFIEVLPATFELLRFVVFGLSSPIVFIAYRCLGE